MPRVGAASGRGPAAALRVLVGGVLRGDGLSWMSRCGAVPLR